MNQSEGGMTGIGGDVFPQCRENGSHLYRAPLKHPLLSHLIPTGRDERNEDEKHTDYTPSARKLNFSAQRQRTATKQQFAQTVAFSIPAGLRDFLPYLSPRQTANLDNRLFPQLSRQTSPCGVSAMSSLKEFSHVL